MNLGAGQPASLPYGVEPQWWYSMQFSSPLQQSDIPFSSVCYHPPPPGNYPPPLHLAQPNHYPPPHHFIPPNPCPPPVHFAQLNSYPPPPPPTPNPYSAYAYQPHFIPTNQFVPPPHTTHEPPPNPQLCSVPPQLDRVTDPEVPIVDSSHSSFQFSDARLDEFIESVSRLLDNHISKCMKGIQVSEDSSPSVPRVCSPLRLQPVTKLSSLLGDAQSLSVSMSHLKQACGEAISATGGVKKRRHWKRNKLLMRNKSLIKGLVVSSRLGNTVSVQMNNTYSVSGTGSIVPNLTSSSVPNPNFVNNGCDSIAYVTGAKSSDVDMICDNEKRSSGVKGEMDNGDGKELGKLEGISVKQGEMQGPYSCDNALSLLDKMSRSDGFCNAGRRVAALTSIWDKGGGGHSKGDTKNLLRDIASNWESVSCLLELQIKQIEKSKEKLKRNSDLVESGANTCVKEGMSFDFELHDGPVTIPAQVHSSYGSTIKDLLEANWVFDPVTHPLYEEDNCDFLMAQVDYYMVQPLKDTNEWGWRKQELRENAISAVSLYAGKTRANLAGNKIMILSVPTKSGNSLQFTFSLMIALIELWKYGYVEKYMRWVTKISVTNFKNECWKFCHDQGRLSRGDEFNSFMVSRNEGCLVVLNLNMNEEDDIEEIELSSDVGDLLNENSIFDPVIKEDDYEFLMAEVTIVKNASLSIFRIKDYNTTVQYMRESKGYGNLFMLDALHVQPLENDEGIVILEGLKYKSTDGDHEKALKYASSAIFYEIHQGDIGESHLRIATYQSLDEAIRCCTNKSAQMVMQLVPIILNEPHLTLEGQKLSFGGREEHYDLQDLIFGCLQVHGITHIVQIDRAANTGLKAFGLHQFTYGDDDYALGWASLLNHSSPHVVESSTYGSKDDYRIPATDQLAILGEQAFSMIFYDKLAWKCEFELQILRMVLLICWFNGLEGYDIFYTAALKRRIAKNGAVTTTLFMTTPFRVGLVHLIRKEDRANVPGALAYVAEAIADVVDPTYNSIFALQRNAKPLLLFVADGVFIFMSSSPCASTFWSACAGAAAMRYEPSKLMILMWIGEGLEKNHFSVEGIVSQLYCDGIMTQFLKDSSSNQIVQRVKPPICSCFVDLALIMNLYRKWIGLVSVIYMQGLVLYSALLKAFGPHDYHDSDDGYVLRWFPMRSCRVQILTPKVKLEDKFFAKGDGLL